MATAVYWQLKENGASCASFADGDKCGTMHRSAFGSEFDEFFCSAEDEDCNFVGISQIFSKMLKKFNPELFEFSI